MGDRPQPLQSLTQIRTENRADFKELDLSQSSVLLPQDMRDGLNAIMAFLPIEPKLYWFQKNNDTQAIAIGAQGSVALGERFKAVAKIAKFAPAWLGKVLNYLPTLAIGGAFTPFGSESGDMQAFAKIEIKLPSVFSLMSSKIASRFADAQIAIQPSASFTSRESWDTSDAYSPIDERIELEAGAVLTVRGVEVSATVSRVSSTRTVTTEIDGKVKTIVIEQVVTKAGNVDSGLLDTVGIHLGSDGRLLDDEWYVYEYGTRQPLDRAVINGDRLFVGGALANPTIREAINDLIAAEGGTISGAIDEKINEIIVQATRETPPDNRFEGAGANAGVIVDKNTNRVIRSSPEPGVAKEVVVGGKSPGSAAGVVRKLDNGTTTADLITPGQSAGTTDKYAVLEDGSVTRNGVAADSGTTRLIKDFVKGTQKSADANSLYTPELKTAPGGLELTVRDPQRTRLYLTDSKGLHITEANGNYEVIITSDKVEIGIKGNPLGFDFSDVGGALGQQLGYRLAGRDQLTGVLYSGALRTFGNNLGDALDEIVGGGSVSNAVGDAFNKFDNELLSNIKAAGIGALSSFLTAELIKALGVGGFAGELANAAGGSVIGQIITQLGSTNPFAGITSAATLGNAVGSFLGAKLAAQIISFDTIGGQLGSAVGSSLGVLAASKLALIGGPLGGPIGAAVGAFVGFIVGGLIGSLFGGTPRSGADVVWNATTQEFAVANVYARKGGSKDAAQGIATAVTSVFNTVLLATGGSLAAGEAVQTGNYGMLKKDFVYRATSTRDESAITARFGGKDAAGKLIAYGAYRGLSDSNFEIIGGDIFVKRALYATLDSANSAAFDTSLLLGNIATAQSYERYLGDATAIGAILSVDDGTGFGAETALLLVRAVELGLTRRSRSDWFGGFNHLIDAAGSNATGVDFFFDYDAITDKVVRQIRVGGYVIGDAIDIGGQTTIEAGLGNDLIRLVGDQLLNVSGNQNLGLVIDGVASAGQARAIAVAATVDAGAGDDTVYASDLGDNVFGGAGNDTLYGGRLDDWLLGGDGDDMLNAGSDGVGTLGGDGNYLDGGAGNDLLIGREGSDWLEGGDGTDILEGGDGGDLLAGGGGVGDQLHGGRGDDQYIFRIGDVGPAGIGNAAIFDEIRDESGITLTTVVQQAYAGSTANNAAALDGSLFRSGRGLGNWAGGGTQVTPQGVAAGGDDALVLGSGIGVEDIKILKSADGKDLIIELWPDGVFAGDRVLMRDWFDSFNKIETLRFADGNELRLGDFDTFILGSDGSETIVGTAADDFVHAGSGDDLVYLLSGNDFGNGGLGNDTVSGDRGNDIVVGANGDDVLIGGYGNDSVSGGRGNDRLTGDYGNDILSGGAGSDEIVGGAGNDVFKYQRGDGRDMLIDSLTDEWVSVWISGQGGQNGYMVSPDGTITHSTFGTLFDGQHWSSRTRYDVESGVLQVHRPANSAITVANAGTDMLEFGIGIDINDVQFQAQGSDLVIGIESSGALTTSFASLADQIVLKEWLSGAKGSIEKFVFFNTGAIDTGAFQLGGGTDGDDAGIAGVTGKRNWLTGGAGDDAVTGAELDDILNGNSGRDILSGGAGLDVLLGGLGDDTLLGGAGADTLVGGQGLDIAAYENAVTVSLSNPGANTGDAAGDTFDSIEGLRGSGLADSLEGDAGENDLRGGQGDDTLKGAGGDDLYIFARGDSGAAGDTIVDIGSSGESVVVDTNGNLQPPYVSTMQVVDREGANYQFEHIVTDSSTGDVVYRRQIDRAVGLGTDFTPPSSFDPMGWVRNSDGSPVYTVVGSKVYQPIVAAGGNDAILFEDMTPQGAAPGADLSIGLSDLSFAFSGNSLVITLNAMANGENIPGGKVIIQNFRSGSAVGANSAIEGLQFSDGSSFSLTELRFDAAGNFLAASGDSQASPVADFIFSDATTLSGGYGNDTLVGGVGANTLQGGDGDDVLVGGIGGDAIQGGAGIDTVSYAGSDGTTANRLIGVSINLSTGGASGTGTEAQGDTISGIENVIGSQANDSLTGNDANNVLKGNRGNDTLSGGGGTGITYGLGDDVLIGDDGDDTLNGGVGADNLDGGTGNDLMDGGGDRDILSGGDGDDILRGDGPTGTAVGGTLAINGGLEDSGDVTNDVVNGSSITTSDLPGWTTTATGFELLSTSSGISGIVGSRALHLDSGTITQSIDGLTAGETFNLTGLHAFRTSSATGGVGIYWNGVLVGSIVAGTTSLSSVSIGAPLTAIQGRNTLAFSSLGAADGTGSVFDNVQLTRTTGAADQLIGGAGKDLLDGGAGNDVLLGGEGDDNATYTVSAGATATTGAAGLYGGAGDDLLDGGAGNDTLSGGLGNDRYLFRVGDGLDEVVTGGGQDDLVFDGIGSGQLWLSEVASTTAGNFDLLITAIGANMTVRVKDWRLPSGAAINQARRIVTADKTLARSDVAALVASFAAQSTAVPASWPANPSQAFVEAMKLWQDSATYVDRAVISGTTSSDYGPTALIAGSLLVGGVKFYSLGGSDTTTGGAGDDEFHYGIDAGFDIITGGAGVDTIMADGDNATIGINASAPNSLSGIERITGNGKSNVVVNLSAAATVDFTNVQIDGIARIVGSSGLDSITGSSGDDIIRGGAGGDILDGGAGNDTYDASDGSTGGTINISNPASGTHVVGAVVDTLSNFENVFGSNGVDTIIGSSGANRLEGRNSSDTIDAGDGDDLLIGGLGGDILRGGGGNDTASYEAQASASGTTMTDTPSGILVDGVSADLLQNASLDGVTAPTASARFGEASGDWFYQIENLTGSGYRDRLAGDNGSNILRGMAGNDALYGGSGDDLLQGDAGDDYLDGGAGSDIAVYVGSRSQYAIDTSQAGWVTISGIHGTDRLKDIETVRFTDATVSLGINANNAPILGQPAMLDTSVEDGADLLYQIPAASFIDLDVSAYGNAVDALTLTATLATGDPLPSWLAFNATSRTFTSVGKVPLAEVGKIYEIKVVATDSGASVSDSFLLAVTQARGADVAGTAGLDQLIGTFRAETIIGLEGADVIKGSAGADRIDGGADLDLVDYSSSIAAVVVDLSAGTGTGGDADGDVLISVEQARGSAFDDRLTGTAGMDDLRGGAGADTITGGAGDDVIEGGADRDILTGGGGNDALYARTLVGGTLEDDLDGGDGVDELRLGGSAGLGITGSAYGAVLDLSAIGAPTSIEHVVGTDSADVIKGNGFNNRISGGLGNDALSGGAGNDILFGGAGSDTLAGDVGDDELRGEDQDDRLIGGAGADKFYGGAGQDTLDYRSSGAGVSINLAAGTAIGGDAQRSDGVSDSFVEMENADGSEFGDTLIGDAGNNVLSGFAGDDVLVGGAGNDMLSGGTGDDALTGGTGNDTLDGGAGTNTAYYAGARSEYTINFAARTIAHATDGTDSLTNVEWAEFAGGVRVNLANQAPTVGAAIANQSPVDNAAFSFQVPLTAFADPEGDALSYSATLADGSALPAWLTFTAATRTFAFASGAPTAVIGQTFAIRVSASDGSGQASSVFNITIAQGAGAPIIGTAGNDSVATLASFAPTFRAESIDGLGGTDTISYASSAAGVTISLAGGPGSGGFAQGDTLANIENLTGSSYGDSLSGSAANDGLKGGDGNDVINAGDGNDSASGDAGNDDLKGGIGSDTIYGGSGGDKLDGGSGTDTLSYYLTDNGALASTGVNVNLADASVSGGDAASDVIVLGTFENLEGTNQADVLRGDGFANVLTGNGGADALYGAGGDDTLYGGVGDDAVLDGGDGNDTTYGGDGIDNIVGGIGADTLRGELGNDVIHGGADNDILDGGDGNDALYGEGGTDTVNGGSGNDTVYASTVGEDTIDGGADNDTVNFGGAASAVTADLTNAAHKLANIENIVGTAYDDALKGTAAINVIDGGVGDDSIEGGAGADALDGGLGTDLLSYAGSTVGTNFQSGYVGQSMVNLAVIVAAVDRTLDGVDVSLLNGTAANADAAGDVISNFENLRGSAFADRLRGSASSTTVYGGAGADVIYGGGGDDRLYGEDGEDIIYGEAGADKIYGGNDRDILFGDGESDELYGGAGNDVLDAGNAGDYLDGGTGDDIMIGGLGADHYVVARNSGLDTIYNYDSDGALDSVSYDVADKIQYSELWFTKVGKDLRVKILGVATATTVKDWFVNATAGDWAAADNFYVDVFVAEDRTTRQVNLAALLAVTAGVAEPTSFSGLTAQQQAQIDGAWGFNQVPTIAAVAGNPTTVLEDGTINLRFTVADAETVSAGITLVATTDGILRSIIPGSDIRVIDAMTREVTIRPNVNAFGTGSLRVRAFDGGLYSNEISVTITVGAVADGVTLGAATSSFAVNAGSAFALTGLSAALLYADGSEAIDYLMLDGLTAGTVVASGGNSFTAAANGSSVNILGWNLSTLTVTAPAGSGADMSLRLRARSRDGAAGSYVYSSEFLSSAIAVAVNGPPTVVGDGDAAPNSVMDGATSGTVGVTALASDPDGASVSYSILSGNGLGWFAINAATGVVSVAAGASVQYEVAQSVALTIRASDGTFTNTGNVTINVVDVNEAPTITSGAAASLNENVVGPISLMTLTSSDPDLAGSANGTSGHVFSIAAGDTSRFEIVGNVLRTKAGVSFDRETVASYGLTIRVRDRNGSGLYSDQSFAVTIGDIAENPTSLGVTPIAFDENVAGAMVATLAAEDQDVGSTFTYQILAGGDGAKFVISGSQLRLAPTQSLDFESGAATVNLQVTDQTGRTFVRNGVSITAGKVNEAPYDLVDNNSINGSGANGVVGSVGDGAGAGTEVGITAHAEDPERDVLTYRLVGNPNGWFAINAATGVVSVATGKTVQYEATTNGQVTINVEAFDGQYAVQNSNLTINVLDVNEAPSFTSLNYATVSEAFAPATKIATIRTGDPDSSLDFGTAGHVIYITSGDTSKFELRATANPNEKELWKREGVVLDYDNPATRSYNLQFRVYDYNGGSGWLDAYQNFTVYVGAVDELPSQPNAFSASVYENSTGYLLTVGGSVDPEGQAVWYDFAAGGNPGGYFSIDAAGKLGLSSAVDNENRPTAFASGYADVSVLAITSTGTAIQTGRITLLNVNEAPSGPSAPGTGSIAENATGFTGIYLSGAVDPDGDGVSYVFADGSTASGNFAIYNGNQLWVTAGFDYEAQTTASVGVYAYANGQRSGAGVTANINVGPVDDNLPVAAGGPISLSLTENAVAGGAILAQMTAIDRDGDALSYDLVGDTKGFWMDSSGYLHAPTSGIDYEGLGGASNLGGDVAISFSLIVRASEGSNPTRYVDQTVNVSVTDISEVVPLFNGANLYYNWNNYGESISQTPAPGVSYSFMSRSSPDPYTGYRYNMVMMSVVANGMALTSYYVSNNYGITYPSRPTTATTAAGYRWEGTPWASNFLMELPPVVLDLQETGIRASNVRVSFDIDGDGIQDNTAWISGGQAFLALDRDGNGQIDKGAEISFQSDHPGATTDLEGLAAYDSNGDGTLDSTDARFSEFLVWQDANENGVSDAGELKSLAEAGIASISLAITKSAPSDEGGQAVLGTSTFTRADGTVGAVGDIALRWQNIAVQTSAPPAAQSLPAGSLLAVDRNGDGRIDTGDETFSASQAFPEFDSNADGFITATDARYFDLRLWKDVNTNGRVELAELTGLDIAGLSAVGPQSDTPAVPALPKVTFQVSDWNGKGRNYLLQGGNGQLSVIPRYARGVLDQGAGRIAPAATLEFGNTTVGMLSTILVDLDGDGLEALRAGKTGAAFDMNGDGVTDDTGWVSGGDGLLVVDRNGDGLIDHASELSFLTEKENATSAWDGLATLDSNRDGKIAASDTRFAELRVWLDGNSDGVSQAGELKTLEALGITEIGLRTSSVGESVKIGNNAPISTSTFTRANGVTATIGNVALAFSPGRGSARSVPAPMTPAELSAASAAAKMMQAMSGFAPEAAGDSLRSSMHDRQPLTDWVTASAA